MKNFNTLFRTLAFLLTIFFVSCSQDENKFDNPEASNLASKKLNRSAQNQPYGKLIIINNTEFEMNYPLICFGSTDHLTINRVDYLIQYITVPANATTTLNSFTSAYNLGLSRSNEWGLNSGWYSTNPNPNLISGQNANNQFGLYANGIDASQGYHAAWGFFGKDGSSKAEIADANDGNIAKIVEFSDGFILNENFGIRLGSNTTVPVGGAWGDIILDLVRFDFIINTLTQNRPTIKFFPEVNFTSTGDTVLTIDQVITM